MKLFFVKVFLLCYTASMCQVYATNDGYVHFISDAPLEVIEASSQQMQGVIDLDKKVFAFKLYIRSFEGFNNPLQQVHFYENYMEADEYPQAIFKGKILEPIDMGKGVYRAKGRLDIHGKSTERIIEVQLDVKEDQVQYSSSFQVPLVDHDIELPQIVYQKIAEIIRVKVEGTMEIRNE